MTDIDLLVRCGGLRVLLHSLAEAPGESTPLLASIFLYIVDLPRTRGYLRPGSDLEVSLQQFLSFGVTQVSIDSVDWSNGRVREGPRIFGQDEGLHQGCGNDVTNLERFVAPPAVYENFSSRYQVYRPHLLLHG